MTDRKAPPQDTRPNPLDAEEVIRLFGGIRPAAAKLGVPATTVQGWKTRGRIPDNRADLVRAAAARYGISLDAARSASSETSQEREMPRKTETRSESPAPEAGATMREGADKDPTPRPRPDHPAARTRGPGPAIAWTALILALVALAGVATEPLWGPRLRTVLPYGSPAAENGSRAAEIEGLARRLAVAETRVRALGEQIENRAPAPDSGLRERFLAMEKELGRLSARLDGLAAGPMADALERRMAALEARVASSPKAVLESLAGRLDALGRDLGEVRRALGEVKERLRATEERIAARAVEEKLDRLERSAADLESRLGRLEERSRGGSDRAAALALALGQLEAAVLSGRPYAAALERMRRLGEGMPRLLSVLASLETGAEKGVPTRAALFQRFAEIAPRLAGEASFSGGTQLLDRVLKRIGSVVALRRVDENAGDVSPVTRAERAVARGDLAAAVAALDGLGGPAGDWVGAARRRLAAEAALEALQEIVVAVLGGDAVSEGGGRDR